jgi:Glycosyltransferases involved in cell wall biogenesis
MPKISIIIPIYNSEKYLNECLDSILKQTFIDYELILVDDGSSDKSLLICEEYARNHPQIIVIYKENSGVSDARNAGIAAATGRYLMFIDSDDYVFKDCLFDIDKTIEDTNTDVIIGKFECYYEDKHMTINDCDLDSQYINGKTLEEVLDYITGFGGSYLYTATRYIFKRELIDKGELSFYSGIYAEDEEWSPRLLCTAKSFSLLEKPFYCIRVRHGSRSEKKNLRYIIDVITVAESLYTYSLKLKNNTYISFIHFRAYNLLLFALRRYKALDDIEKAAFYKYISDKRDPFLLLLGLNQDTRKILGIIAPFSKIIYQ